MNLRRMLHLGGGEPAGSLTCLERGCTPLRQSWRRVLSSKRCIHLDGQCYCKPQCFEHSVGLRFAAIAVSGGQGRPAERRIPLGLLMLSRGHLSSQQLQLALDAQRRNGRGKLGEWVEDLGFATLSQVTAALSAQWACPVFAASSVPDASLARMLPLRLLSEFRMCPVQFVRHSRTLYVGFSDRVHYVALYAIEQILQCRTQPGLIESRAMDGLLEQLAEDRRPSELCFESWSEPIDMARITCGHALKFGARDVRIVSCWPFTWVRLQASKGHADLLFHLPDRGSDVRVDHSLSRAASYG